MPDIAIWNQCNNHCLMCSNPFSFQSQEISSFYSYKNHIISRWTGSQWRPDESINLTGGEPTIHPDFFKIIHWFRSQYPQNRITLATNGRMLFYPNFSQKLLKIDNLLLEIAIHGYDAKTHDAVTRVKGSFEQTIEGIHNILRYKHNSQQLEIRIIITKLNYRYLDKILAFIKREFNIEQIQRVALIFLEMEGQAKDNFDLVAITYQEAMRYLPKVVKNWASFFNDLSLYHFPLCVLPSSIWPYAWRTLRGEEVKFVSQCKKCFVKKYCLGIHRDYLLMVGSKEFQPVAKKKIKIKANQSFYQPIKAVLDS